MVTERSLESLHLPPDCHNTGDKVGNQEDEYHKDTKFSPTQLAMVPHGLSPFSCREGACSNVSIEYTG